MRANRHRMVKNGDRYSFVNSPVESEGYERDSFADGGPPRNRRKRGAMADVVIVGMKSKPRADKRARGGGVDDDDGSVIHHHHFHHDARDIDPESLAAIHDAAADGDVQIHHHMHGADDAEDGEDGEAGADLPMTGDPEEEED